MNRTIFILISIVFFLLAGWFIYAQFIFYRTPLSLGFEQTILEDQIVSGGTQQEGIPAIDEPTFETIASADQYLDDNGFGLALETKGKTRFYPYQILVWHGVVNDIVDQIPMVVTYCPLSFSGAVYERTVDTDVLSLSPSGKLLNSNTLLVDHNTNSLWSQSTGKAIRGEHAGTTLIRRTSFVMTWSSFKRAYPSGTVLSRETNISRDYTRSPYGAYETNHAIWFPVSSDDARLTTKRLVVGFELADATKAYPLDLVQKQQIIHDKIGGEAVRIIWDEKKETVRGYTEKGDQLIDEIPAQMHYWFIWSVFHP